MVINRGLYYSSPILIEFLGVHKNSSNFYEQVDGYVEQPSPCRLHCLYVKDH